MTSWYKFRTKAVFEVFLSKCDRQECHFKNMQNIMFKYLLV